MRRMDGDLGLSETNAYVGVMEVMESQNLVTQASWDN